MGIWIAFVYPNAIKRLQDPDKIKIADFTKTLQDTRRLESIVGSVLESATVATGITMVFFAKLIVSGTVLYKVNHQFFESAGIAFIVFLTLVQSFAVFGVIWSNYLFIDDLHVRRENQERNNDF
jgi:tRNA A37 threonylcarbamoyladenosine dehydratase